PSGPAAARARARAEREARQLAQVDHPHIVKLHALDWHDDRPYLVMEYVPGGTLAHQVRAHWANPDRHGWANWFAWAARVAEDVARAAAAAHAAGIIHRDLKPGNVLIDQFGVPKLSDFGVATVLDPGR